MLEIDATRIPLEFDSGASIPTPFYIYDFDVLDRRLTRLRDRFAGLFRPSFAVKSNPNRALIGRVLSCIDHIDASSAHEVERALSVGVSPDHISWSGPGKRRSELEVLSKLGLTIVVEAEDEIELLSEITATYSAPQDIVLRINPDHVPKGFGASMSGNPSQFGIDEPAIGHAIDLIKRAPGLRLTGFHAYTGSMCLTPEPIAENIANLCAIFRKAVALAEIVPNTLIFGAGFGIPLHAGQKPLDIDALHALVEPHIRELASDPVLGAARRLLEVGRWISGPTGALVSSVLSAKTSRGLAVAVCDAGFNNHLAACGMMGSVFQKNYPIQAIRRQGSADDPPQEQMLAGPLCTSIDQLARRIELPPLRRGDAIAVLMSGAYGLTASPTRFISHPEPAEYALSDGKLTDISESGLNRLGSLVPGLRP